MFLQHAKAFLVNMKACGPVLVSDKLVYSAYHEDYNVGYEWPLFKFLHFLFESEALAYDGGILITLLQTMQA